MKLHQKKFIFIY